MWSQVSAHKALEVEDLIIHHSVWGHDDRSAQLADFQVAAEKAHPIGASKDSPLL